MKQNWLFRLFGRNKRNEKYSHDDIHDDRLPLEELKEFEMEEIEANKEFEERNKLSVLEYREATITGCIKPCNYEEAGLASRFINIEIDNFLNHSFTYINRVQLAGNYTLSLKTIKGGPRSFRKIYVSDNISECEFNIQTHLKVDDTIESVWHAFLIQSYIDKIKGVNLYIIFTKEDINSIKTFRNDTLPQLNNFDITPYIGKYKNKYFISYCKFSEWGGLIRQNIEITLFNNRISTYNCFQGISLYRYDCGIMI